MYTFIWRDLTSRVLLFYVTVANSFQYFVFVINFSICLFLSFCFPADRIVTYLYPLFTNLSIFTFLIGQSSIKVFHEVNLTLQVMYLARFVQVTH